MTIFLAPCVTVIELVGFTNDQWRSKVRDLQRIPQILTKLPSAWKTSLPKPVYFIPDFDDTQGYYAAANGVSDAGVVP